MVCICMYMYVKYKFLTTNDMYAEHYYMITNITNMLHILTTTNYLTGMECGW